MVIERRKLYNILFDAKSFNECLATLNLVSCRDLQALALNDTPERGRMIMKSLLGESQNFHNLSTKSIMTRIFFILVSLQSPLWRRCLRRHRSASNAQRYLKSFRILYGAHAEDMFSIRHDNVVSFNRDTHTRNMFS
jgi:hypothetical protein